MIRNHISKNQGYLSDFYEQFDFIEMSYANIPHHLFILHLYAYS